MPPRRKRVTMSPQDRREAIVAAGRQVFTSTGFSRATMADIAHAADMAQGTFYLYFDSKEHLLAAVWERYVEGLLEITTRILDDERDWWPTMDALWSALLEHAVHNAELHRTVYNSANAKALELCKQSNRRVVDLICDYVGEGAKAGAFRATDPQMACRLTYHAVDGLLDELIGQDTSLDLPELTRWTTELVHRALGDPDVVH